MHLIDANQYAERLHNIMACWNCSSCLSSEEANIAVGHLKVALQVLSSMPTIDLDSLVKHGKWIQVYTINMDPHDRIRYKCSLCGRYEDHKEPYCNCGAKMDKED